MLMYNIMVVRYFIGVYWGVDGSGIFLGAHSCKGVGYEGVVDRHNKLAYRHGLIVVARTFVTSPNSRADSHMKALGPRHRMFILLSE